MGIESNTELKSKALKANMEETRVHVEIEEKYKIILTVFNRYHGLQKELITFLEELSNPMRNWQFIVSEARRYAFDHIHLFISNSNADEIISLFIDIFHEAIESNQEDTEPKSRGWFQSGYINARAEIQSEAADNLMQFIQKLIKAS
ncbi:pyruvate, phosphate dikinase PpdK, partial [Candidatus Magnetoovum chiemensis]